MKKSLRITAWIAGGLAALLLLALIAGWLLLSASLPVLDGSRALPGLARPASLQRDAQGTVTVRAVNALDAMRALGFVHGQERFFEMDLARRSAAGELSEILGAVTLPMDRDKRRHRLRARLTAQWSRMPSEDRAAISAYTGGVNAGLAALTAKPWQYTVLSTAPRAWTEVDSMLVVGEMYFMLQARGFEERFDEIRLRDRIGERVFAWMKPTGGPWDAPLDAAPMPPPAPMPSAAELDTRGKPAVAAWRMADRETLPGSNNWAVGGTLTADGRAILADDMHLGLGVPGIWFRTQFELTDPKNPRRVAGVTLPGMPAIVVGSNGDVAWGFTNTTAQWFDWVALAPGAAVTTATETILVKGAAPESLAVREAAFGPVLKSHGGRDYALSWTLYREGAINLTANRMMFARHMDEAVAIAQQSGIPHQNLLVADRHGNIAWTVMGRIPVNAAGTREVRRGVATDEAALPLGWLPPERYPLVKNPADGRLWTANSRQLAGGGSALLGDGGFDLGARTTQIRDRLREKARLDEKDLHAIQLDDESRFLKRWAALARAAAAGEALLPTAAALDRWNGHAAVDQPGHRIARAFRQRVLESLWQAWLAAADTVADPRPPAQKYTGFHYDGRFEYPAWQAIEARVPHLLPAPHASWEAFLAAQLKAVQDELIAAEGSVDAATWGKRNAARIRHPFSRAMPALSRFLDMPPHPQAGDNHMPRVATPTFGASQRMVVAPGREERGILTVAGGQSGHPLSPFYGAGHEAWHRAEPTPLLAGEARHSLQLAP